MRQSRPLNFIPLQMRHAAILSFHGSLHTLELRPNIGDNSVEIL
jgi:hypothetical protein